MSYSEFDETSYEQLQLFVERGKKGNLPEKLVEYLNIIEMIRALYDKHKTKSFIVKLLAKPPYNFSEYNANRYFIDALNFFNVDNQVKREAWANIYADRFDKLALLCIELDDLESARKNWETAAKFRMGDEKQQPVPRELLERRPIFYTIRPKDAGFREVNRRKLAAWIDELPDISGDERLRLHREALDDKSEGNVLGFETEDIDFIDVK